MVVIGRKAEDSVLVSALECGRVRSFRVKGLWVVVVARVAEWGGEEGDVSCEGGGFGKIFGIYGFDIVVSCKMIRT